MSPLLTSVSCLGNAHNPGALLRLIVRIQGGKVEVLGVC